MARPLSEDLRKRLVAAVRGGSSARAAGRRFDVSASAAVKLIRREKDTGGVATGRIGGHRKRLLAEHEAFLRAETASRPGVTLRELQLALEGRGVMVRSLNTIHLMLRRLGLTHKKRACGRPSRTART